MSVNNVSRLRKPMPCPECAKPSDRESHPFCSERCRYLDLARWLNGSYAIPVLEAEENREPDEDNQD